MTSTGSCPWCGFACRPRWVHVAIESGKPIAKVFEVIVIDIVPAIPAQKGNYHGIFDQI